jgi:catechol 2,3-dioxygenase-like lactoylglutathione lyase family enzyme
MSKIQEEGEATFKTSQARYTDLKLEAVVIPVSDVDRAKSFYSKLGWRLDADFVAGESFRVVQFTPPGSPASIHFGKGLTSAAPGAAQNLYVFHRAGPGQPPVNGRDPARRSYVSFASFSDPDGNTWLLQEITARLAGRVDAEETTFSSPAELADALRRAAAAHGEHEKRIGAPDANWPDWYAEYMAAEQSGRELPK